jgi:hypothetical protein
MMTDANGCRLAEQDRGVLEALRRAIHSLLSLARTGIDVIAIGETVDAIENLMNGSDGEVNVGLETRFRRGEDGFEEGLFVCLRINDEEIVLDELHTTYSKEVGSDHFTVGHPTLHPRCHFDEHCVAKWIEQLQDASAWDEATLTVSRDHV